MSTSRPTTSHRLLAAVCAAALTLFAADATGDPQGDVSVLDSSLEFDPPANPGDPLHYRAQVEHPTGTTLQLERPDEDSRWTELDRHVERMDTDDAATTTRLEVEYAVFRPGPTAGPPVSAQFAGIDAQIALDDHRLTVRDTIDENESLAEPGDARTVDSEYGQLLWLAAFGVVLVVTTGILVYRRRRRPGGREPRFPREVALAELQQLRADTPEDDEQTLRHCERARRIVRQFLAKRWDVAALESTTDEIIEQLEQLDRSGEDLDLEQLDEWLRACDRVQFGGQPPGTEQLERLMDDAVEVVESIPPRCDDEGNGDDEDEDEHRQDDETQ